MSVTTLEKSRLSELEVTIERGQKTFVEVGLALAEIRETRLYRDGFGTFEEYCKDRWGWQRNYANKLIASADAVIEMGTIVPKEELPSVQSESQARELAKIKDPVQRAEVWQAVNEIAEETKVAVTAKLITNAVKTLTEQPAIETTVRQDTYVVLDDAPRQAPDDALWLWGRLRDFEREGVLSEDINRVVGKMTKAMRPDVYRLVPKIKSWLGGLDN